MASMTAFTAADAARVWREECQAFIGTVLVPAPVGCFAEVEATSTEAYVVNCPTVYRPGVFNGRFRIKVNPIDGVTPFPLQVTRRLNVHPGDESEIRKVFAADMAELLYKVNRVFAKHNMP